MKKSSNNQVYSMHSFYTGLLDIRHSPLLLLTLGISHMFNILHTGKTFAWEKFNSFYDFHLNISHILETL